MIRKLLTHAFAALAVLALPAFAGDGGYKVVVHAGNPTASMTRADVARMFLKKIATWPDKLAVVPVDQDRSSPVRRAFSAEVHQKDPNAISAYWQVLVYSGRDLPPRILRSDDDVLAFVRSNPGAIGYVSTDASLSGVRVLAVR